MDESGREGSGREGSGREGSGRLDLFLFSLVRHHPGPVLDYGCGSGRFVDFCWSEGLDIAGTDTYKGPYAGWNPKTSRIFPTDQGIVPFPDGHFNALVSNQVLEHIDEPEMNGVAAETIRVLSPMGAAYFIYPTKLTFLEGHLGVPLFHLFPKTKVREIYLHACFMLNIGFWRSEEKRGKRTTYSRQEWVEASANRFDEQVIYHPVSEWRSLFQQQQVRIENIGYELVLFAVPRQVRIALRKLSKFYMMRAMLNLMAEIRVGRVWKITRLPSSLA